LKPNLTAGELSPKLKMAMKVEKVKLMFSILRMVLEPKDRNGICKKDGTSVYTRKNGALTQSNNIQPFIFFKYSFGL
jgi:hypothetical protein